ncbi:MAG: T9SS type A sorting domain-containing protein, partial [Bacteroidales bacterium]|nr:T9SS type A sorting domain-containing protein [Bacteroidales bacterium]
YKDGQLFDKSSSSTYTDKIDNALTHSYAISAAYENCNSLISTPINTFSKAVKLPWNQGFETFSNTAQHGDTILLTSESMIRYHNTNFGRLRIHAGDEFYHTGNAAATMDCHLPGVNSNNQLIIPVNLANYKNCTDLELSFWYMSHGYKSGNDKVWISSSNSSTWIEIFDFRTVKEQGNWCHITGIDIDSVLKANNQVVSGDFKIRFSQEYYHSAITKSYNSGYSIDDIAIIRTGKFEGVQIEPTSLKLRLREGISHTEDFSICNVADEDIHLNIHVEDAGTCNWLSVAQHTDSIESKDSKKYQLSICTSQLQAGMHKGNLVFTSKLDSGLSVKMPIELTVIANNNCTLPAEWIVDKNSVQNDVITAQINIGSEYKKSGILGVFSNNQCVGTARPTYFPTKEEYGYVLSYEGREGEHLTFQYFDTLECTMYNLDQEYIFSKDLTTGNQNSPIILTWNECMHLTFNSGWNWFSINLTCDNMSINSLFAQLNLSNGDMIKSQTASAIYYENYGWFGTIKELDPKTMYMIHLKEESQFSLCGTPVDVESTPIELNPGWNWIGYLPQNSQSVQDAFDLKNSITIGDYLKSQTQSCHYLGARPGWFGDLQEMHPYQGYKLNVYNKDTLVYAEKDETPALREDKNASYANVITKLNHNLYENSGTIVATVTEGSQIVTGKNTILMAYVNSEFRGASEAHYFEPTQTYVFHLNVYSNNNDDILTFRFMDTETGAIYGCEETLEFTPDMIRYSAYGPFILTMNSEPLENEQVEESVFNLASYPNPSNGIINIQFELESADWTTISLHDMMGRRYPVIVDKLFDAGMNQFSWNSAVLPTGIYTLQLKTTSSTSSIKITLID